MAYNLYIYVYLAAPLWLIEMTSAHSPRCRYVLNDIYICMCLYHIYAYIYMAYDLYTYVYMAAPPWLRQRRRALPAASTR